MLMKEFKGPGAVKGYSQPGRPIQRPVLIVGGVEVVLQSTIRHEFKYQKPIVLVSTVAE
jgi:hypothetical protein